MNALWFRDTTPHTPPLLSSLGKMVSVPMVWATPANSAFFPRRARGRVHPDSM